MKSVLVVFALLLATTAFADKEKGGREGATAVFVNFTSFGTGIDEATADKTDKLIAKAEKKDLITSQNTQYYGREGERLTCVKFKEPGPSRAFIKALARPILKDAKTVGRERTEVRLGLSCDKYDEATEQDLRKYLQSR